MENGPSPKGAASLPGPQRLGRHWIRSDHGRKPPFRRRRRAGPWEKPPPEV